MLFEAFHILMGLRTFRTEIRRARRTVSDGQIPRQTRATFDRTLRQRVTFDLSDQDVVTLQHLQRWNLEETDKITPPIRRDEHDDEVT